jgi:DNA-binding response OmpR family regulator
MNNRKFTILVVEDDESLQEIYKKKLRLNGRVIQKAFSAEEAFEIINKTTPDMIILDLGLPGASGIDFLKMIFNEKELPDIPVFIVSGNGNIQAKLQCFISGASRFFTKPVDSDELLKCIEKIERQKSQCSLN